MVIISGMRKRPQLNGARAQILNNVADDAGYLTVTLMDGGRSVNRMKVHPNRLQPVRSASDPGLNHPPKLGGAYDEMSAFSSWSGDKSSWRSSCRSHSRRSTSFSSSRRGRLSSSV